MARSDVWTEAARYYDERLAGNQYLVPGADVSRTPIAVAHSL